MIKFLIKTGLRISVAIVELMMPPITVIAIGCCTSEPIPCPNAIGKKPRLATIAVIRIGRNLERQVSLKSLLFLKVSMRIIEFKRLIPINAMKPI